MAFSLPFAEMQHTRERASRSNCVRDRKGKETMEIEPEKKNIPMLHHIVYINLSICLAGGIGCGVYVVLMADTAVGFYAGTGMC